ncbi:MAG: N-acetylmuramoyl-L-alanine amidase [Clostridiaceae bacterium]|nr:N-acetylmuramoyl-L-alanine amidase [Clostridiaceae bacterium]
MAKFGKQTVVILCYNTAMKKILQRAPKIVFIIFFLVMLMIISSCGNLPGLPNTDPSASPTNHGKITATSSITASPTAVRTEPSPTPTPTPVPAPTLQDFPEGIPRDSTDPVAEPERIANERGGWPAESSLHDFYAAELSQYRGRAEDASPLKGITVIVDPGHGGKDPGAIAGDCTEKVSNLQISLLLAERLRTYGAEVLLTRTEDEYVSLYKRIGLGSMFIAERALPRLAESGADTFWLRQLQADYQKMIEVNNDNVDPRRGEIGYRGQAQGIGVNELWRKHMDLQRLANDVLWLSIHSNSSLNTDIRGLKLFFNTNRGTVDLENRMLTKEPNCEILPANPSYHLYDDAARNRLAQFIYAEVIALVPELKDPADNPVLSGNYAFTREINLTSVLVEIGFMSNPEDLKIIIDPAKQAKVAEGIARAVYKHYTQ